MAEGQRSAGERAMRLLELIDWSERFPNESSWEIAIRQSTLCLCGRQKQIGNRYCWDCDAEWKDWPASPAI
jgi:hypothetical protein